MGVRGGMRTMKGKNSGGEDERNELRSTRISSRYPATVESVMCSQEPANEIIL